MGRAVGATTDVGLMLYPATGVRSSHPTVPLRRQAGSPVSGRSRWCVSANLALPSIGPLPLARFSQSRTSIHRPRIFDVGITGLDHETELLPVLSPASSLNSISTQPSQLG